MKCNHLNITSLGLARSNFTLFGGVKPVQNQYNHCFHVWFDHRSLFCCQPSFSVVFLFTCVIDTLNPLRSKAGRMCDGLSISLISWLCRCKMACGWVTELTLCLMGHHPFPSSLLILYFSSVTCQLSSVADKFKECKVFPSWRSFAKQIFLCCGGILRWNKLETGSVGF